MTNPDAKDSGTTKLARTSIILGAWTALASVAYYLSWAPLTVPIPFEDAAMLFRYAENLAGGDGIVWNSGEDPSTSDGATDLGFVLVLAPLVRLGLEPATAALVLNLLAMFLIGVIFGQLGKRHWSLPTWLITMAVTALSLSATSIIAGGFSAPVLGLLLLVIAYMTYTLDRVTEQAGDGIWHYLIFGLFTSLAGWWRPEAFLLAPLVVAAVIAERKLSGAAILRSVSRRAALLTIVGFGIGGMTWVLLRMLYFGQLIPTSGVNKVSSPTWETSLRIISDSGRYYFVALMLIWIVVVSLALTGGYRKPITFLLASIGIASIIWVPFDLTFNWWGRVWWPLLPVLTLLTFATAARGLARFTDFRKTSIASALALSIFVISLFAYQTSIDKSGLIAQDELAGRYFFSPFHTELYARLKPLDTSNLRVATTEAGLLPLALDEGLALDTWVHNNRSIATEGPEVLPDELMAFNPNLIVVHGPTPSEFLGNPCDGPFGPGWQRQATLLYEFAMKNDFQLLRSEESGVCDTWNIFASDTVPAIVEKEIVELPSWAKQLVP